MHNIARLNKLNLFNKLNKLGVNEKMIVQLRGGRSGETYNVQDSIDMSPPPNI